MKVKTILYSAFLIFLSVSFIYIPEIMPKEKKLNGLQVASVNPKSVGRHWNGRLKNGLDAHSLFQKYNESILPLSHSSRQYSTKEMVNMLIELSKWIKIKWPDSERLQVGDISRKGGGTFRPTHESHQNGLDVDIIYLRKNRSEKPITNERFFVEAFVGYHENFVDESIKSVTSNFDVQRNYQLLKHIVTTYPVHELYIDCVIIKSLRAHSLILFNEKEKWLDSLKHYPNHKGHIHIRLQCPPSHSNCIKDVHSHGQPWINCM